MSRDPESGLKAAAKVWGAHPIGWPSPPLRRPRWWQFRERRRLHSLEAVFDRLSDEALSRYWAQVLLGQSVYEDAGGFLMRCYRAMLDLPVEEPVREADVIEDLLRQAGER